MNAQTLIARLIRSGAGAIIFALFVALPYAQSSVEKIETTQQTKKQEDELALARAAVNKPNNKADQPETGRIWGGYSVQSALELGYRFENTRGNRNSFLSQVNVRDGFRVLEYSLDSRALDGRGMLYDSLRSEINNAGGDQSQNFTLRMDKARVYRFDSHVRRFNYFRTPGPNFARDTRNSDLRQQVSDYNLRLFPQRAVRFNLGYGRSSAKGRYSPDISFGNDFFQLLGATRWESNDYRAGMDATYGGWNFSASALHRRFKDDPSITSKPFVDPGFLNPTDLATLTSLSRVVPIRSHATVVSASVQGNIGERVHLVVRGLHDEEFSRGIYNQSYLGNTTTANQRSTVTFDADSVTKRPSDIVDAAISFDLNKHFTLNNSFRYSSFRIQGDMRTNQITVSQTGTSPPGTPSISRTFGDRLTGLTSYWNTLDLGMNFGKKFSANLGWRAMQREVEILGSVTSANSPAFTPSVRANDEAESIDTHAFVGGFRVRPTNRASFIFDVEHGTNNNAFIRINPLDFTRFRFRTQIQATDHLSFVGAFTSIDRVNPTPQVQNESDTRTYTVSVDWNPHARVWVNAGYDHHNLFTTANLRYFLGTGASRVEVLGKLLAYGRMNSVFTNVRFGLTNRLDFLMVYYYIKDLGAPSVTTGTSDTILALPLRRHNPEARLAYRFNNHLTGNVSYRHFSYNERDFSALDYRSHISTISLRFIF
ncbi:MAG TPA: hypothetical protein VFZ34_07730 [Blastocatellia bacterium]|nr:hypothetical protein [Blastocatellia bacterium]